MSLQGLLLQDLIKIQSTNPAKMKIKIKNNLITIENLFLTSSVISSKGIQSLGIVIKL